MNHLLPIPKNNRLHSYELGVFPNACPGRPAFFSVLLLLLKQLCLDAEKRINIAPKLFQFQFLLLHLKLSYSPHLFPVFDRLYTFQKM